MKLIELNVSEWGLDLRTYFGDVYLPTRTFLTIGAIVAVLLAAKYIRKAWR